MRLRVVLSALFFLVWGFVQARAELSFYADDLENGLGVVFVEGYFEPQQSLDAFIDLLSSRDVDVVVFNSPGGNPVKAMEMGRIIRIFNLSTLQPKTFECTSACALAFMGGVRRIADPGAIGVHQNSFAPGAGPSLDQAVSTVQGLTVLILAYMREMGVASELLEVAYSYESHDMRYLSQSEMQRFGLITVPPVEPEVAVAPAFPANPETSQQLAPPIGGPYIAAGQARLSGHVRHPKGHAPIKSQPDGSSSSLAELGNGTPLEIVADHDRWYEVEVEGRRGFLHHTWVRVENYAIGDFEDRHIQIKSFEHEWEALAFAKSYYAKTSVFLATNGWYAVTLQGMLPLEDAEAVLKRLKAERRIPSDSFVTYGNTYTQQVCCK